MFFLGFFGAGQCFVSPKFKYSCFFRNLWRRAVFREPPALACDALLHFARRESTGAHLQVPTAGAHPMAKLYVN